MKLLALLLLYPLVACCLFACGGPSTVASPSQVQYAGPTIANRYDQCIEANPYLIGSPMWYNWTNNCKYRYGLE